jgi:sigma-B regulation protein RsbU (phosphoserine phosphatase)
MHDAGASITTFLTDGALVALCDAASAMLGARLLLLDEHDRVVNTTGGLVSQGPLHIEIGDVLPAEGVREPIIVDRHTIGAIAIAPTADPISSYARDFLRLLASIVSETCTHALRRASRQAELDVLHKLSRLLVSSRGFQETIETGLRSAIELIDADAGTLRLLDEATDQLVLRAAIGLSDDYIHAAAVLPAHEMLARAALDGEPVAVDDLQSDERVLRADAIREEGLVSMLSAPLVFQDETMGILRLYTREPRRFSRADNAILASIGRQIAAAIATARLVDRAAEARHTKRQMEIASDIQRRMLPQSLPQHPRLEIATEYDPCFDLGGDFYDLFEVHGKVGLVVGDVVGKGVGAALLMANVRAALRAYAAEDADPASVVSRTNRALCRDSLPNEFATIFYALIDPDSLQVTYCNAGHEPTLLVRRDGEAIAFERLDEGGLVAGVDPDHAYTDKTAQLRNGDFLVAFSDGLSEAMNFEKHIFGRPRISDAITTMLSASPDAGARTIASHLLWEMRRYIGLAEQSDDTTIVVVRAGE